jgi:hypothetical protein
MKLPMNVSLPKESNARWRILVLAVLTNALVVAAPGDGYAGAVRRDRR